MTLKARFDLDVWAAKRKLFEELARDTEVFVHINLDAEGVRVPEKLRKAENRVLVLKFSPRYELRLEVLEEGVEQLLRFGGEDFPIFVAWDAIFVIRDERALKAGQWPWSAPVAMRLDKNVLVEMPGGYEVVIEPSGEVRAPIYPQ